MKISKNMITIILLIFLGLLLTIVGTSYAFFTVENVENNTFQIIGGDLNYTLTSDLLVDQKIEIEANDGIEISVTLNTTNSIEMKYQLYYETLDTEIKVYYLPSSDLTSGTIKKEEEKKFLLYIENNKDTPVVMTLGVIGSLANKEVILASGQLPITEEKILTTVNTFEYTKTSQTFEVERTGRYQIELWGAVGGGGDPTGNPASYPGNGAYTTGEIELRHGQKLYVFVGGAGVTDSRTGTASLTTFYWTEGGFNGGGSCLGLGNGTGGGATDIALVDSEIILNDKKIYTRSFESLKSRIMVAAGGGGKSRHGFENQTSIVTRYLGGTGGTLTGGRGYITYGTNDMCLGRGCVGTGGTQTSGGKTSAVNGSYIEGKTNYGSFGEGGYGYGRDFWNYYGFSSGGGAGYYGGSGTYGVPGAGGGSSYISGFTGCDAISEESTSDNIIHTGQSVHYSNLTFKNANMIAGTASMPTPTGNTTMVGNNGNGFAKITYLGRS